MVPDKASTSNHQNWHIYLISHTVYAVTDYFRLAVIEGQKTVENAAPDGFAAVYLVNRLS